MIEAKFGRASRELMLKETEDALRRSPDFIITNYLGLSVSDLEGLRKKLNKASITYVIVKNSICKRVLEYLKLSELVKDIEGGVGLGLLGTGADSTQASKIMVDFSKQKESFKIKSAFIDGKYLSADIIKRIAALPPKEILLATLLQTMKSPITGFVGVLGGLLRKFVYVINAVKEKQESFKGKGA